MPDDTLVMNDVRIIGTETFPDRAYSWIEKTEWLSITFEVPKGEAKQIQKVFENKHYKPATYKVKIEKFNPKIITDSVKCVNCGEVKGYFYQYSDEKEKNIQICDGCGNNRAEVFC